MGTTKSAKQRLVDAAFAMVEAVNHFEENPSADGSMDSDYRFDLFDEALDEYYKDRKAYEQL